MYSGIIFKKKKKKKKKNFLLKSKNLICLLWNLYYLPKDLSLNLTSAYANLVIYKIKKVIRDHNVLVWRKFFALIYVSAMLFTCKLFPLDINSKIIFCKSKIVQLTRCFWSMTYCKQSIYIGANLSLRHSYLMLIHFSFRKINETVNLGKFIIFATR